MCMREVTSPAAWQGGGKGVQGAWGAGVQLLPPGPLAKPGLSQESNRWYDERGG